MSCAVVTTATSTTSTFRARPKYVPGIAFTSFCGEVINFAEPHSTNLNKKHEAIHNMLKPMSRIAKNVRSQLVRSGSLKKPWRLPVSLRDFSTTCRHPNMPGDHTGSRLPTEFTCSATQTRRGWSARTRGITSSPVLNETKSPEGIPTGL